MKHQQSEACPRGVEELVNAGQLSHLCTCVVWSAGGRSELTFFSCATLYHDRRPSPCETRSPVQSNHTSATSKPPGRPRDPCLAAAGHEGRSQLQGGLRTHRAAGRPPQCQPKGPPCQLHCPASSAPDSAAAAEAASRPAGHPPSRGLHTASGGDRRAGAAHGGRLRQQQL